jgi:hypothetical protein
MRTEGLPMSTTPSGNNPINASWIEDAEVIEPPGNWFSDLFALWTVPPKPLGSPFNLNQVWYSFPGLQDSDFIIQPVIQYGIDSVGGDATHWYMGSWHCGDSSCIASTLKHISAGDAMSGSIVASSCSAGKCTWTIIANDLTNGTSDTLIVHNENQDYFFATGGAVEAYNMDVCDRYPINGTAYSGVSLHDKNGVHLTPTWAKLVQSGLNPSCRFNVTATASTVSLAHNTVTITASGGLDAYCSGLCVPSVIKSISASGHSITFTSMAGGVGTMTLSGFTASGGLSSTCPPLMSCTSITSMTATGGNTITVKDSGGHTGTITLTGGKASGGTTFTSIEAITAQTNTISLRNGALGPYGFINLFQ